MSRVCLASWRSPYRPIGALTCPLATDHVSLVLNRGSSRHRGLVAITRDRTSAVLLMVIIGTASPIAAGVQSLTIDLSTQQIGAPPRNFEFWRAGEADPGHWKVVRETSAGGLSIQQSGADRGARPSLAVYAPVSAADAKVRARFKLVAGSMPSAGIALRVTSPDDYYLVRASAFEQRLALLHVVHGAAEEIAGVDAEIVQDHWQTLEVVSRGSGFTMWLNDQWALTAFDGGKLVGGRFGIWTERDDVTRFDQIEIAPFT
jgi:hypothetical protein